MRRAASVLVAAALAAGCGGDGAGRSELPRVRLALDFTPNAVHAPIYAAARKGHDRERGFQLRIVPPGSAPDSLKLLASGRADVAVLDIHDLGLARERGQDCCGLSWRAMGATSSASAWSRSGSRPCPA